jgi:hypothetical protein
MLFDNRANPNFARTALMEITCPVCMEISAKFELHGTRFNLRFAPAPRATADVNLSVALG